MFRFLTKWALAVVLGTAGWIGSSGPAAAQYGGPFGGFGFPATPFSPFMGSYPTYSFRNPYTGGVFSYQIPAYQIPYGYSYFNPYTGRVMNYQANSLYFPMSYGGYGGGYGGYALPSSTYNFGGTAAGGYGMSTNPITNQQLKQLRAASYQSAYPSGGYGDQRSAMSPRWTTAADDKSAAKPAEVNEALLKASEKDINSAEALNALAAEVRKLEGKGAKAEAPLLPADVLAQVAYEGTAKESNDSPTAGAVPKWGPRGATVSELVRHMDRNKLRFAPAPSGTQEAYGALYRGLSGYYVALASAKR